MLKRKEYFTKSEHIAVCTAFFAGLFIPLFGMLNTLHNYDDIAVQPYGYGTGLRSGRWFLEILGDFFEGSFGNYNLPWLNGILFIALLSVSSGMIVQLLHIKDKLIAGLIGSLFVAFPSVTSVMFFRYTTVYYGIAVLLAVSAAWILPKYKYIGYILSCIFTTLSLGIYQAYFSLTVGLLILYLLWKAFRKDSSFRVLFIEGLLACLTLVIGLILYLSILKVQLFNVGESLTSYQGINTIGSISLNQIPKLIKEAYTKFCLMPISNSYKLSSIPTLKWSYIVLGIIDSLLLTYCLIVRHRSLLVSILIILLCILFPFAANIVVVMCPDSYVYTIMVYGFVLLLMVPPVLLECMPSKDRQPIIIKKMVTKTISILLSIILFSYTYLNNVNYSIMFYNNRQVENYLNSMITQIRMTEGFSTDKKWAFIGNITDPLLREVWDKAPMYGGNAKRNDLLNSYSRKDWIKVYMGYKPKFANDEEIIEITEMKDYESMPYWPNEGSIKTINEFIVVKLSDE